jgi:hypothetical protein
LREKKQKVEHRLNTMTVTVDASLAMRLSAAGKVLPSIPCRAGGPVFTFRRNGR